MFGVDGANKALASAAAESAFVGDAVDQPWQSAGAVEQGLDGGWFDQRQFAARQMQAVGQIGVEFVAVEAGDVMSDDEALAERLAGRPWTGIVGVR